MASSKQSIQSTSTPPSSPRQNEEPPMPTTNVQEQLPVQTLSLSHGPNFLNSIPTPTFHLGQAALSYEGNYFRINRDGYIANMEGGRIRDDLTFTEKMVFIEVPCGCDVIHVLEQFAQRNELSLSVAVAMGQISAIEISYPNSTNRRELVTGNFQLVALSGTYYSVGVASNNVVSCFNVTLSGPQQGELIGGLVVGRMTAATVVTVFAFITKE